MAQVVWTLRAKSDLSEIHQFIEKNSPLYALITVENIVKRTKLLAEHSRSGRIVPEFNRDDIREIIEGNYRIIYYCKEDHVLITRIYHRSRLLKKL